MERIDFAKIKAGVTIDSVLAHYGVQTKKRNNTYLVANCPLPSHTSKDSAFSFAINTGKNLWTCHSDSCKEHSGVAGGDVFDLTGLMEGLTRPLDVAKRLVEWFPFLNGVDKQVKPAAPAVVGENKPLAFTLKDINPEHPMIQGKGISVETAREFNVGGFSGKGSMANRIVFSLYENGSLIGYAGRTTLAVTPDNWKWRLPPGLVKSFVYGLERCDPAKLLILTESFWGPLYFHQRGAQAASLMGSDMTEAQERYLAPFKTICVALDNDAAGIEKSKGIIERLKRNHKVFKASLMEG